MGVKLFFFLCLLSCGYLYAGNEGKLYDGEAVVFRSFEQETMNSYRADSDFAYTEASVDPGNWDRFIQWLGGILKKIFTHVPKGDLHKYISLVVKIVLWALGIFAVVMIFISLFKHGVFNVISKSNKTIDLNFEKLEEKVLETDWQALIDVEIKAARYNVAIRLLFLQTIQILNEKHLITWEKNKTNYDYLRELTKKGYRDGFQTLMQYYNYGWFGGFEVGESRFYNIHAKFQAFNTVGE